MTQDPVQPIAIVGIGCRYADARGPEEFWEILRSGRNTVRDAPQHRIDLGYDVDHFYDPRPRVPGKISSKKAGFLEHPELFDPAAFGIAPRDALTMDPQQRLMVEVTWDALEDAGVVPDSLVGERVAVILGYMAEDYSRERTGVLGEEAVFRGHDVFTVGGMSHAVLSGRIAYLLGVTGPSFTLDTACSSSLIATHLACESLRRGESKWAIAGGANLFLSPEGNIALSRSGMLSMSGACKAFDADADGFVRAEGAGVVLLRPLEDAIESGDRIYAVIRGSGISSDGRDGGHMMAPGRKGQAQAMRDAYAQAQIPPSKIQYVETHGTGTLIGDPVELGALADVMGPGRSPGEALRVASAKGNLGHTESASGVAGLIKTALAIQHRQLPAQLHFKRPNPTIPWDEIPIRVQDKLTDWPTDGPALAGVNSFGISGTNAHVVLESPPESPFPSPSPSPSPTAQSPRPPRPRKYLIPLSAQSERALYDLAQAYFDFLAHPLAEPFTDLVYTLTSKRAHRAHRLTLVASDPGEMRQELEHYLAGSAFSSVRTGAAPAEPTQSLAMVFPGQGGQWLGMAKELLEDEPRFRRSIERLDAAYRAEVSWSLLEVLDGRSEIDWTHRLDILQPLLVAVEIALAELWMHWGARPTHVIGQSMGEIAAACVAGALGDREVARLACQRGRTVAEAPGDGAMAVTALSRAEAERRLGDGREGIEVAGSNGPKTTILSGDRPALDAFLRELEEEDVFVRRLNVDFASHCFHMDPLLERFEKRIAGVAPKATQIPFHSTVDGVETPGERLDVDYWIRNLREPVALDLGLASVFAASPRTFIEASPHPVLSHSIGDVAKSISAEAVVVGSIQNGLDERQTFLTSLGELFVCGFEVNWSAQQASGKVVRTPLYPYQRERYWFSGRRRTDTFRATHPLLGRPLESSIDPSLVSWDFDLDGDSAGFLRDYQRDASNGDDCVAPDGLFPELALAAAEALWPGSRATLSELNAHAPLRIDPAKGARCQLVFRRSGERGGELQFASRRPEKARWDVHLTARLDVRTVASETFKGDAQSEGAAETRPALDRPTEGTNTLSARDFYAAIESCGVQLGPLARTTREVEVGGSAVVGGEADGIFRIARLMLPRACESEWFAFHAHPALMENAIQLCGTFFDRPVAVELESVGSMSFAGGLGSRVLCQASLSPLEAPQHRNVLCADLLFFGEEGEWLGEMKSVRVRGLRPTADATPVPWADSSSAVSSLSLLGTPDALLSIDWKTLPLDGPADTSPQSARYGVVSDCPETARAFLDALEVEGLEGFAAHSLESLATRCDEMRAEPPRPWSLIVIVPDDSSSWLADLPSDWVQPTMEGASAILFVHGRAPFRTSAPASLGSASGIESHWMEAFSNPGDAPSFRSVFVSVAAGENPGAGWVPRVVSSSEDRRFIFREGSLFVPRLVEGIAPPRRKDWEKAGERNFRAVHDLGPGANSVFFEEVPEDDPEQAGESNRGETVEVEVECVALSQLDALTNLGLSRDARRVRVGVGMDFAGVVVSADPAGAFKPGDRVCGLMEGALSRRVRVPVSHVAKGPSSFDAVTRATLPMPFVLAEQVLSVLGGLQAGDRVLIQSAAGGVGQAMVSVASAMGALVTATSNRPFAVEALGNLGVRVIPALADDPSSPARGLRPASFDLIVGTASGAELEKSLERLAPSGRYVDLAPRARYWLPELNGRALSENRSIHCVDLDAMMKAGSPKIAASLEQAAKQLEQGHFRPPSSTVFPVSEAHRALRYLVQNRHIGRVCIDLTGAADLSIRPQRAVQTGRSSSEDPAVRWLLSGDAVDRRKDLAASLNAGRAERETSEAAVEVETAGIASTLRSRRTSRDEASWHWVHVSTGDSADLEAFEAASAQTQPGTIAGVCLVHEANSDLLKVAPSGLVAASSLDEDAAAISVDFEGAPGNRVLLTVDRAVSTESIAEMVQTMPVEPGGPSRRWLLSPSALENVMAAAGEDGSAGFFEWLGSASERDSGTVYSVAELWAMDPPGRRVAMREVVRGSLAEVLSLSTEQRREVDLGLRVDQLGLDSLMTMELFVSMTRDLGMAISASDFTEVPTLEAVATLLVDRLEASHQES